MLVWLFRHHQLRKGSLLGSVNPIDVLQLLYFSSLCKVKKVLMAFSFAFFILCAPVFQVLSSNVNNRQEAAKYRLQGLEYQSSGKLDLAIKAMEKSVQLDPANAIGKINLGWALHLANRDKQARVILEQAVLEHPQSLEALNALGIVYLVTGDLSKAVLTHNKAIELEPKDEIAHYNLSLAYHLLAKYDQGIAEGLAACRLEPNNPHPKLAVSLNLSSKGDRVKSRFYYRLAINLDERYRNSGYLDQLKRAGFSRKQIEQLRRILGNLDLT